MTAKEALARYARIVGPAKASQHLAVVRRYLAWGGSGDPGQFAAYIRSLERDGLKSGTIAYHQRILRSFLRSAGLPVPPEVWRHSEEGDRRVAFSAEWIRSAIAVARRPDTDPTDRWILCLATIYGLRAVEVSRIGPEDVDAERGRLFIRTAKHGQPRWQWMPPAVARVWREDGGTVSLKRVHLALKNLAVVGGLPLEPGADLHAIRRGLVVSLVAAGVPEGALGHFMRWQVARRGGGAVYREAARYSHPSEVVGVTGPEAPAAILPGCREEDAVVWDRHPFCRAWES